MKRPHSESTWTRFRQRSEPTDLIIAGYLMLFGIGLLVFGRQTPSARYLVVVHLVLLAATWWIVVHWHDRTRGFTGFIRLLYVPILYTFLYSETQVAIHWLFPGFFDQQVVSFEHWLLGVDLNLWIRSIQYPLLNEWMMFGYFSYYLLIPLLALTLFFQHRAAELRQFVTAVTIAFVISYAGFILYPVEGPRHFFADQFQQPLAGYFFVPLVRWVIDGAAIHGGCMPSSHVAAASVVLIWAYRTIPRMGYALTPVVITLAIGTVWGRFHYISDVAVGLPIGIAAVWLGDYCWRTSRVSALAGSREPQAAEVAVARTMGGTEDRRV